MEVFTGGSLASPRSIAVPEKVLGYQYGLFRDNDKSIRVLTLASGRPNDPLIGTLEAVDVDSAGSYEPISYVWADPGPQDCEYQIYIRDADGERLLKLSGGSIFAALRRVRLPDRERRVWADQICIDQNNVEERSEQVQFMNKIYKNAKHVLVWLGEENKKGEAESTFTLIRKLDELRNEAARGRPNDQSIRKLEHLVEKNKETLHALTNRKWFKRGWIVQEIGTKASATLFWGDAEIDWEMLYGVCESLTDHHVLRSNHNINTSDIKFLFQRFVEPDAKSYHANRFNCIYELHRARGLNFTDDRDRVFAFLGHYSFQSPHVPSQELTSIRADYKKTVEQVYVDVAKRALRGSGGNSALIALAAVQHADKNLPSRREMGTRDLCRNKLPSWVADWRCHRGFILSEPISPHSAHGSSKPKLEIGGDDNALLRIYGLEVDTVEARSRTLVHKEFHRPRKHEGGETTIEYLWHEICQKDRFNLHDEYLNGQKAFFAFMQTLSNGCVQIAGREGTPYHEIPDSRWLEQAALYLERTLGGSDVMSQELRDLVKPKREHGKEEWSRSANGASKNRAFARTRKGYYVLGPAVLKEGDIVCVLFGGKVPFCLRPVGGQYLLVGECYVHGLMKQEAMDMMARRELFEMVFELV
ncbi:hypothetical protein DL765_002785 [Monosporascus sp. GIB2]|nr:hypothetical protein DL765_002785 [Monosporascus sp. GIB2]